MSISALTSDAVERAFLSIEEIKGEVGKEHGVLQLEGESASSQQSRIFTIIEATIGNLQRLAEKESHYSFTGVGSVVPIFTQIEETNKRVQEILFKLEQCLKYLKESKERDQRQVELLGGLHQDGVIPSFQLRDFRQIDLERACGKLSDEQQKTQETLDRCNQVWRESLERLCYVLKNKELPAAPERSWGEWAMGREGAPRQISTPEEYKVFFAQQQPKEEAADSGFVVAWQFFRDLQGKPALRAASEVKLPGNIEGARALYTDAAAASAAGAAKSPVTVHRQGSVGELRKQFGAEEAQRPLAATPPAGNAAADEATA